MKRLDFPVQIYHRTNLEQVGSFDAKRVAIIGEHEIVLDFKHHVWFWLSAIVLVIVLTTFCIESHKDIVLLKEENGVLKESIELATIDHNIELLAGKYATSKTSIPKDKEEIFKFVVESGAWYPDIIMAQLIMESGAGTSNVYRHSRNLYGMKKVGEGPRSRPSLQIPGMTYSGYGMYLNWQHSILDRVLWDKWMFKNEKPSSREEYYKKIDGIYAEDPAYIEKVRKVAKEWEPKINAIQSQISLDTLFKETND